MGKFKKKKGGELPAISTASLPDIVFMLLFFFMTTTVMRDSSALVENKLAFSDQATKIKHKNLYEFIMIGQPKDEKYGKEPKIQLNDVFASVEEIRAFVIKARESKPDEDKQKVTFGFKTDMNATMGLISDVKDELRKENALKIAYYTRTGDVSMNK
jgi:biopolymer transport protein ExbD